MFSGWTTKILLCTVSYNTSTQTCQIWLVPASDTNWLNPSSGSGCRVPVFTLSMCIVVDVLSSIIILYRLFSTVYMYGLKAPCIPYMEGSEIQIFYILGRHWNLNLLYKEGTELWIFYIRKALSFESSILGRHWVLRSNTVSQGFCKTTLWHRETLKELTDCLSKACILYIRWASSALYRCSLKKS